MLFVPKITAYNFKNIAFLFVKALTAAILMSLIEVSSTKAKGPYRDYDLVLSTVIRFVPDRG